MAAQTSAEGIADALKTTELRYQRLFETARDGILILDSEEGKITDANPFMTELLGYSHDELLGKELWEIGLHQNKEARQEAFQQLKQDHYIRYEGLPLENRRGERREVEFVSNLYRENGHTVIQCNIRDITEQAERTRRDQFLTNLAERTHHLSNPDEIIADTVRSVGEFLGVSRCTFGDIDTEADTCTNHLDYCADDSVSSIMGVFPISAFGVFVTTEFEAGRSVVVDDVRDDPVRVPEVSLAAYEAIKNRALAHEAKQRRVAHKRTDQILESITDAFFALDREFRFTYLNAQAERELLRTQNQLLGQNIWAEFPEAVDGPFYDQYRRVMAEGIPF